MKPALDIFIERVIKRCRGYETPLNRDSLADIFELALLETQDQLEKMHKEHAAQLKEGRYPPLSRTD